MIYLKQKVELLAPAKNKECAFAAINAGADAVYIGPESFGARKKAGNSIDDLKEIVQYAHKFLVKVYATVNTIIYDNELAEVEKLIWKLYEIGIDAIIFQDFSIFEMNLPPIALHASTQCNNDSIEKIKFLKELNVERVVLPREFSVDEVRNIVNSIEIETEVFIHGALCVSYSGQCYLSNYIGGRSANRGECAQPCRKKYTLIDENNKIVLNSSYLLSMKDNNLSKHIKELVSAGVTSFKIEGRLKDADYVVNTVSFYRKLIDSISNDLRPSVGVLQSDFVPDISKTFNRGYTNFYFDGKRKKFINSLTPKFIGEKIGTVISVRGKQIGLKTSVPLNISDKIVYFNSENELEGTTITRINCNNVELLNIGSIKKGSIIYRNFDAEFYKNLEMSKFQRKIPLSISVDNKGIIFKSFGCNSVYYKFCEEFEKSKNNTKAKDNIRKQISKLGSTEFVAAKVDISEDFDLFIPVSKINEIRRFLVKSLQQLSENNYKPNFRDTQVKNIDYPTKILNYSYNISNKKSKDFYEKCGCLVNEMSPEIEKPKNKINLMKTKHCLRDFAGICLKNSTDKRKLFLADEFGNKFPLEFDCKKCIMLIKEPG